MPTGRLSLEQAKAVRNGAHETFQTQLMQVQDDLSVRGVGGRIVDRAEETMAHAAEVARENKGVVAGTIAALAIWSLRAPIFARLSKLWTDDEDNTPERNIDDE